MIENFTLFVIPKHSQSFKNSYQRSNNERPHGDKTAELNDGNSQAKFFKDKLDD